MSDTRVGVVGAGAAGAAAAFALRDAAAVTVFEAAGRVGGRAATRRRRGCVYDYGANYVKSDDGRVNDLLATLGTGGRIDVDAPVWTFDADGTIAEGDDREAHKWSYEAGIATLARRLLDRAGATVRCHTRVDRLVRRDGGWRLLGTPVGTDVDADAVDADVADLGRFDHVVVTPPAPVTADVLRASAWGDDRLGACVAACEAVPYRTIYTAALRYDIELDRPWYALVDVSRDHDIGWLAREACKPGHVPSGELLVAQLAPDWSSERCGDPPGAVCADAAALVADLLRDDRLAEPAWADGHCWRHALADGAAALPGTADAGLHFAGDWTAGEGRVHLALREGLDAASRIVDRG